MVRLKVCGLTNLDDARHAAVCGADLLGFIFVPGSPRYIAPAQAAAISAALRAEGCPAELVGVFANTPVEQVNAIAAACGLAYVQLHSGYTTEHTLYLDISFWVTHRVSGAIPWEALAAYQAAAYLLDTYRPDALGGTGTSWDWQALANAPAHLRLILAGGLTPVNVAAAIATAAQLGAPLWGVDVSSGVERSPGLKDHDSVRAFIQAAKGASV
jgi:phosphoribosylanthranilate isomerase